MEFCSKYGYDYGFDGSNSDFVDLDNINQRVEMRKADMNLIGFKFKILASKSTCRTIDENIETTNKLIKCNTCEAFLTLTSEANLINNSDNKEKLEWICEFCETVNDLSGKLKIDLPNYEDVTFVIEENDEPTYAKFYDHDYLIFCIDVSGSMGTKLKTTDGSTMTRLDGVRTACIENLKELKKEFPNRRVALVTFSDVVKYFGDCCDLKKSEPCITIGRSVNYANKSSTSVSSIQYSNEIDNIGKPFFNEEYEENEENDTNSLNQSNLFSKEKLIELANKEEADLRPVYRSCTQLKRKITSLTIEGSTSLGPALVFSIGLCSKKSGSQIILCTDGVANRGIGSIDDIKDQSEAEKFYEDISEYAKEKGVSVNVISVCPENSDCKLALIGKVADKTNGVLKITNPVDLSEEFKSILNNKIIATGVKAKLVLSKYLYVRDEELEALECKAIDLNDQSEKQDLELIKKSFIEKNVGIINEESEISFEYGVRKLPSDQPFVKNLDKLPFQLQVTYYDLDGRKVVRVFTKHLKFTKSRVKAEQNVVAKDLLYANAAQKMSSQILKSNVSVAKLIQKQIKHMEAANNWTTPQSFTSTSKLIDNLNNTQQNLSLMSDKIAEEIFAAKKLSRTKFCDTQMNTLDSNSNF